MDENGYLITKKSTSETNIEGLCLQMLDNNYQQGSQQQGTGCIAADWYREISGIKKEYEESISN